MVETQSYGFIKVYKELLQALGVNEALIFGELYSEYLYFEKENRLENDMFYSTVANIKLNTTLGKYQQKKAISNLINNGYIEVKLMGLPKRRWFKINGQKTSQLESKKPDLLGQETSHNMDSNLPTVRKETGQQYGYSDIPK